MKNKLLNNFFYFILGAIVFSGIAVFATINILGTNVFYDNKNTKLTSTDMQGAVDEIYDKAFKNSCYTNNKTKYTESILNGADPVLGQNMIPVTIADDRKVYYANVNSEWYSYNHKIWANAVMLIDTPSKSYKECEEINNADIKAYFVWIPRYKYKIWDTGNYNGYYELSTISDTNAENALRKIANQARTIEVVFESKGATVSNGSTVGTYLTHPAFTSFNVNGLWVGKFEATGSITNPTVKPNEVALANKSLFEFWNSLYNLSRVNDSHMMKNTEWGATAYLSHSQYGINKEITLNNNPNLITGYAAAPNTDYSSCVGAYDSKCSEKVTWTALQGYTASTTGNISGIYDMSGGVNEYMAAYINGYGVRTSNNVESGFTSDPATLKGAKYFDVYNNSSETWYAYNNRKLGDATGEMGPFYRYREIDDSPRNHNAWYGDLSYFARAAYPWFYRGGNYAQGILAGQFHFDRFTGAAIAGGGTRLVLAPQ